MESTERLASGVEFRREGRRIVGPAITYGDRSPSHRERFEAGAFAADLKDGRTRWLDVEHRVREAIAWSPDGGMRLEETREGVMMDATIPEIPAGERALMDVRLKRLGGLSIEFNSLAESRDSDGTRVIQRAKLNGVGLVRSPSYHLSQAEVRGRSGRSLRSHTPTGKRLGCRCSGSGCKTASFSGSAYQAAMKQAFGRPKGDLIAAYKSYDRPLASVSKGTLRREGAAGVIIDLPDDAAGAAVIAASESAGVVVRPYLDATVSKGVVEELADGTRNMHYADAGALEIRGFIVSATDEKQGWPDPKIVPTPDLEPRSEGGLWLCL